MSIAQVNVIVDQELIKQQITEKVDAIMREVMFTWDTNEMAKRMCMSKRFIEDEFLHDPRMRLLERRKPGGKRFWFYEPSLKAIKEIMDEWE